MKVFVWQGGDVLRDYASGLVVVLAADEATAWDKLRQQHLRAFVQLLTGHSFGIESVDDLYFYWNDLWEDEKLKPGFPIIPVAYDINDAPVAVCWGGQ
ncbi:hypothetical protein CcrC1_gp322 [Caulobacter phage C1]|nr:hypothetical protein CcrC1_gp322 [Caulobacter phage C1]UTU08551.1 hypothetical protein CcrC2_gp323 [Caulobacter phage C2]UTU09067.1 hypothetical protein CcrJ4_gp318 [Caulobacter phage J4]UTU09626.1 hypothetical protein CcrBL47_gp340 [Caulobacter phage BL47]UTU10184.1 hypothetical protein CcrRB23_gp322 [Caulobacter phage RB23]WGN97218.1 hypothetical protein [Bertelyvirus sp.]